MRQPYEKLVRDGIPARLDAAGVRYEVRRATSEEMPALLIAKLQEEIGELLAATSDDEALEEIADVFEVLAALASQHGADETQTLSRRAAKHEARGGFDEGIVLSLDGGRPMTSPLDTALIVPFDLPPGLEALRRRCVPEATAGLAAHATVMYPFAEPGALNDSIRARLGKVVSAHDAFACRLAGQSRWPGVLFASVETDAPFQTLNAKLISEFSEFPSDNGGFEFVPHVTIAVGPAASEPETVNDPAWRELPTVCRASRVDLIVRRGAGWDVKWSFEMSRRG